MSKQKNEYIYSKSLDSSLVDTFEFIKTKFRRGDVDVIVICYNTHFWYHWLRSEINFLRIHYATKKCSTVLPLRGWGDLKLSCIVLPPPSIRVLNWSNWALETSRGVLKLIHLTTSKQPGVVRPPSYVLYLAPAAVTTGSMRVFSWKPVFAKGILPPEVVIWLKASVRGFSAAFSDWNIGVLIV